MRTNQCGKRDAQGTLCAVDPAAVHADVGRQLLLCISEFAAEARRHGPLGQALHLNILILTLHLHTCICHVIRIHSRENVLLTNDREIQACRASILRKTCARLGSCISEPVWLNNEDMQLPD